MPDALLADLLDRLRAAPAQAVELPGTALIQWSADSVAALRAAGVLALGRPASGVVCPGCEQACPMAVEQEPRAGREPLLFIVCDKRDDVASVQVPPVALERWRVTDAGLADALARLLGADAARLIGGDVPKYRLGVVAGRLRKDVAYLVRQAGALVLLLAGHSLDLLAVLDVLDGRLTVDVNLLRRSVDAPAGVSVPAELPEARRLRLLALVEAEKKRDPRKFLQAAADKEGITIYALRQVIYRKGKVKPAADAVADIVRGLSGPVSAPSKRKR